MPQRKAFTLAELVVVLGVLVALGSIAIPICSGCLSNASTSVTLANLSAASQAFEQYWLDTKQVVLDGLNTEATESERFEIRWLTINPTTNDATVQFIPSLRSGWNGPYLSSGVTGTSDGRILDGWNRSLTTQYVNPNAVEKDVRVVSAGPNGIVDTPPNIATTDLDSSDIGDDLYVAIIAR